MSRRQEILHGQKPIFLGLLLMAIIYAAISALSIFGVDNRVEFVALGGLILAWLPVLFGTLQLRKEKLEFKYAFYLSIGSLVALFAQTGLGIKNFLNNMDAQTFIQFDVMFFGYIAFLGMMVLYRLMMKGLNILFAENAQSAPTGEWKSVWLIGLIIIFAGTLFIPVTTLFGGVIAKLMAGVVILIVLGTEMYLCGYINKSANALQKRR